MIIQFEISDKSFELLKAIHEAGMAEFRDSEYRSLEAFKTSKDFNPEKGAFRSEEWFKARNFCDIQDLEELIERNLIDVDGMSWHQTWIVSKFGEEVLEKHKNG
jgi:hypothetical protein